MPHFRLGFTHHVQRTTTVGDGPRSLRHATPRSAVAWRGVLGRWGLGPDGECAPLRARASRLAALSRPGAPFGRVSRMLRILAAAHRRGRACPVPFPSSRHVRHGRPPALARISHQPLDAMTKLYTNLMVAGIAMGLNDHRLRWPRPRRSFGPVCAHATSTVGPAMLSVASTHTEPKSSAIIAATGEKCGLAGALGSPLRSHHRIIRFFYPSIPNRRMIALLFRAESRERYPMKHHPHPPTLVTRGD